MNRRNRSVFIYILVILGLLTVGISPACKFISGQSSFIEICTAFGIKKIPVPENGVVPQDEERQLADQCLFCFSSQVQKTLYNQPITSFVSRETILLQAVFDAGRGVIKPAVLPLEARAPPFFS